MKRYESTARASLALGIWLGVSGCGASSATGGGASVVSGAAATPDSTAPESSGMKASAAPVSIHTTDLMPIGLTTIGATSLGNHVYVLGGYFGKPHAYSQKDQSREFYRLDTASHRWDKLPGVGPVQSAILVNDGRYVYRVGGMIAKNEADQPENMQ